MASVSAWQSAVAAEYARLTTFLSLSPADLDAGITLRTNDACCGHQREESAYGGPRDAHPHGLIMLPIDETELAALPSSYSFDMPPRNATPGDEVTWPEWRKCLFHEVCHQVQEDVFQRDPHDGYNGHNVNWWEAVAWVGDRLNLARTKFGLLMMPPRDFLQGGRPGAVEPPTWYLDGGPIPASWPGA